MKKTVYLHIGMFKTGTTTLQDFLNINKDQLENYGFFVPRGEMDFHHLIPISIMNKICSTTLNFKIIPKYSFEYYVSQLQNQIVSTKCKNIIISSEFFCDFVHPQHKDSLNSLSLVLKNIFSDLNVKVIIYLRSPHSFIYSFYKELIKGGSSSTLSEFLHWCIDNKSYHLYQSQLLEYYENIFGSDALIINTYSRQSLLNNDIVSDFLDIIHCDFPYTVPINDRNVSISDSQALLQFIYNNATSAITEGNIYTILDRIHSMQRPLDDPLIQDAIYNECQKLRTKYNLNLSPDMPVFQPTLDKDDVTAYTLHLLATLVKQNNELLQLLKK